MSDLFRKVRWSTDWLQVVSTSMCLTRLSEMNGCM